MKTFLFTMCVSFACFASAEDAIDDSELRTTTDLLHGFNDQELAEARKAIPPRREPPLGLARPRLVKATGHVYEDRNANGRRDDDENTLPNVIVSDGERVLRTGDDGAYSFRIRMDENPHYRFVVVTRPTGYKPTGAYFLRIPFAEDRTRYDAEFGFVRDEASAKREFWFITASDSQFTKLEEMLATAKDYAQVTSAPRASTLGKPAFLATAGDLTMNGSQFEWDMYDRIRRSSKIPVYEGFGGHDGNCLDPRCTVNFEQRIGPPYYSWDYGGVHFIQIVTETGYLKPTARLRQNDWMQADLKTLPAKMPVIAVSHYPLDAAWFDQRKAEGINVIAQIGAHWHVVHAGSRNGIPVLNSAPARGRDWGAYSRTYRWVFVSPEGVRSKLRVAGQYKRLRVVAPGPRAHVERQPLVVLAYDTALLLKSVTCRWTAPDGKVTTTPLRQQGDWSWHGVFEPDGAGRWQCDLEATDVTGALWNRAQTIDVGSRTRETSEKISANELPYVLASEPPRNFAEGPSPPLFPLWVTHTGSVHVLHNSPVVSEGKVFVSVGNPNAGAPGAGVLCLDAATGKQIWNADSPHGDIRGPVSVHNDVVYAITGESWVAAYDAQTGRPLWSKPMHPSYQDGRPLAINNTPPIPTRHGLLVSDWQKPQRLLDYATGNELSQLSGDVGYYASFATVFDDVMYSVRRGGGNAIRLPDGKEIYKFQEPSRSTSAPIVVDGKLIYNGSSGIRVREASTGKSIWLKGTTNAGYQNAIPVVWGDRILVNGANLQIFDLDTGETRKTVKCAQEADRFLRSRRQAMAGSSTPIVAGDHAFFGHDDTSIRAINRAGDVVWEHRLGTPVKTAPAVSGNKLFVHDYAGNLWCFASIADQSDVQMPSRGICAHRGASETHPENTLAAFREAVRLGAQMIEFDVASTKDGQLVLMHDGTIDRTTNGKGPVRDWTLVELKKLDAGSWKNAMFKGERIPTLDEALAIMPENIWLNVHLKGDVELAENVTKRIVANKRLHQSFLACGVKAAEAAKRIDGRIKICNMERQGNSLTYVRETIAMKADFIQLYTGNFVDPAHSKLLKQHGIRINFCCADESNFVRRLFAAGTEFPLVDRLDPMLKVADEMGIERLEPVYRSSPKRSITHGPIVGHITSNSALVWARCSKPGKYHLSARSDGGGELQTEGQSSAEHDGCVVWRLESLRPATQYRYAIEFGDEKLVEGDDLFFETAPTLGLTTVRLGFASCAKEDEGSTAVWRQMRVADPHAVVLLGDTPYIDSIDLAVQRRRYGEFAAAAGFKELVRNRSLYATWDDHDFGRNDTDGNLKGKENSRRAFMEYRANSSYGDGSAGIYTKFLRGGVEVFLLDTRYFAATQQSQFDKDRPTLLGAEQWKWLRRELKASTAPFKVLACGMIWNGAVRPGKKDHWGTYSHERNALFDFIGKERISGVVLVGGDIHRTRVLRYETTNQAGYDIPELITSPTHAGVIANANVPHPALVHDSGKPNTFLLMTVDTNNDPATLSANFLNKDGQSFFETKFTEQELRKPN